MTETESQHYREGIRLFNAGEYWHAHEQWEICWLGSVEPASQFYKGIIQAAAALVHWKKGNPRGLQLNWAKSRPKLAALPPDTQGIDVRALIADMDRFVSANGAGVPAPQLTLVHGAASAA